MIPPAWVDVLADLEHSIGFAQRVVAAFLRAVNVGGALRLLVPLNLYQAAYLFLRETSTPAAAKQLVLEQRAAVAAMQRIFPRRRAG